MFFWGGWARVGVEVANAMAAIEAKSGNLSPEGANDLARERHISRASSGNDPGSPEYDSVVRR